MTPKAARRAQAVADSVEESLEELIEGAQELLDQIGDQQGEVFDRLRTRITDTIDSLTSRLDDFRSNAGHMTLQGAKAAIRFAQRNPWRAVAIGAVVALGVQLLLHSGGDSDDD